MDNQQANNYAVMKAAFASMTGTPGWQYAIALAELVINKMERKAIDEDDENKSKGLKYDARGARKFWESIRQEIETVKAIGDALQHDPIEDFFAIKEDYERAHERAANA